MKQYRKLFALAIVAILVVASVAILTKPHTSSNDGDQLTNTQANGTPDPTVTITNFSNYSNAFAAVDTQAIGHALYAKVKSYRPNDTSKHYDATIRSGSLTTSSRSYTDDNGNVINSPIVTFIVDIPAAKESYQLQQYGNENLSMSPLYINCLPASDLKYGMFGCVDAP